MDKTTRLKFRVGSRVTLGVILVTILVGCSEPSRNASADGSPTQTSVTPGPDSIVNTSDLLVYGGTPAGILATVEARRLGKTVILVEPTLHIGGMVAGGLSSTDSGTSGVISGLTAQFFKRTNVIEVATTTMPPRSPFMVEPHVARDVFQQMLNEVNVTPLLNRHVTQVVKVGAVIQSVKMDDAQIYKAKQYIDASYEGDLMALAGVTYTWGRESTAQYNEPEAGVRAPTALLSNVNFDPYVLAGDPSSGLLPYVTTAPLPAVGSADHHIMAYNYRMCATDVATHRDNAVPYSQLKPKDYDVKSFSGVQKLVDQMTRVPGYSAKGVANYFFYPATDSSGKLLPYANGKFDINGGGVYSSDVVGIVNSYPDGDEKTRDQVRQIIASYDAGMLYYLATDAHVPADVRAYVNSFGACRDEFADNNYFPYQLYVREARRMVGEFVMTEDHILLQSPIQDAIAMGGYSMDSHVRQYVSINGQFMYEGNADRSPYERVGIAPGTPFPISLQALMPKKTQVVNLLNPVTVSASSMAYRALRMEPQYMMMGSAAGVAAALAIEQNVAVQDLPYTGVRALLEKDGQLFTQLGDCFLFDKIVRNSEPTLAYLHMSVPKGSKCLSETRVCKRGVLTGTYKYSSCTVGS